MNKVTILSRTEPRYLQLLNRLATEGDNMAGWDLLRLFVEAVREDDMPRPELLLNVADRIERVIGGEDPRTVFPSRRNVGRPAKYEKHQRIALNLELNRRKGLTYENAVLETANDYNVSEALVRKAHRRNQDWAQAFIDSFLPDDKSP